MAARNMAKHFGSEGYGQGGSKKPKPKPKTTARIVSVPKPKPNTSARIVSKPKPKPNTNARITTGNTVPQTVTWKQDGKTYTAKVAMVNGKFKITGASGARAQAGAARANRKKK